MKKRSKESRKALHDKIIGLGEKSLRKSYYPELRRRLEELEEKNRQLIREIEDRKQVEEALRENRERLEAILEANPAPVVVYNTEGFVEYLNPAFQKVFGWTFDELYGKRVPFVPPKEKDLAQAKIEKIYAKQKTVSFNTRRLTKDGELRDIFIRAAPIKGKDHEPTGMVVNLIDVTKIKKLEFQLQSAQRMKSLGTLAGGIAHDFNNLLMGILGNASLLLHDKAPSDPEYKKLKSIEKYILDGSKLTRQLLGFAKGGKYEVKPANINEIIKKNSSMFGRTKKEIRIHEKYQKRVWTVMIDQGQIEQVLLNLYVNAWQAMPAGGNLYLQTANVRYGEDAARGFDVKPGDYVRVSVTDTGCGMDEKTRLQIFDPFFTTRPRSRGSGLGLASAYGIIKNHGGFINVYSQIGKGTTFNIYLPASDEKMVPGTKSIQATLTGTGTILLVDDEEMILEVGQAMLEKVGYRVLTAGGGEAALQVYRENGTQIDLVILDMIMPDMGGSEVYPRLKALNPDIKVMLSSGYSLNGMAAEILDQGCDGFIQKPFNLQDLSVKIKEVLV